MNIRNFKKLALLILIGFIALAGVACKKTSGGGWVDSVVLDKKATFGYQASCSNIEYSPGLFVGHVTGQFQYKDHGAGVAFHGDVDFTPYEENTDFTSCETISLILDDTGNAPVFFMAGAYTAIPKNQGAGGSFIVAVGDGVCDEGDAIIVSVEDGVFGGYNNESCLGGGNLTVFNR